ncbi:MAG: DUF1302 domain-containing protein [Nevskiales bacterium]
MHALLYSVSRDYPPRRFALPALLLLLLAATPASALELKFGEINGAVDTTLNASVGLRIDEPDPRFIGQGNGGEAFSTNGDDGNQAFGKNDLYAAAAKITSDLSLNYRDYGVFLRGSYVYDAELNSKNDFFDRTDFAGPPSRTQGPADFDRKTNDVQDLIGSDGNLLDAYFFSSFALGERTVSYRIGKQVLNWGESTFVPNGINSNVAANLNLARVPGFDVKEVFVPVEKVWAATSIAGWAELEVFYQWKWRETVIDAAGSFFSTNDFAGVGGERAEIGFGRCPENSAPQTCVFANGGSAVPRAPDRLPEDGGQYGAALNLSLPYLNSIGVGLYAMNYHSRLPLISALAATTPGMAGSARYLVEYPEDIRLYGISFNSTLPDNWGGFAVQGEYSLKQDQPLQIDDVETVLAGLRVGLPNQIDAMDGRPRNPGEFIQGFIRRDVSQLDLSALKIYGPIEWLRSDQLTLLAEVGLSKVHSMPRESELRLEGPGTTTAGNAAVASTVGVPQQTDGYATATSWGYRIFGRLNYNSVLNLFNITPTLFYGNDVNGTSPTPILNFIEGRKQITAAVGVSYLDTWQLDLGYTDFFGGGGFNLLEDRDFLSFAIRYNF